MIRGVLVRRVLVSGLSPLLAIEVVVSPGICRCVVESQRSEATFTALALQQSHLLHVPLCAILLQRTTSTAPTAAQDSSNEDEEHGYQHERKDAFNRNHNEELGGGSSFAFWLLSAEVAYF